MESSALVKDVKTRVRFCFKAKILMSSAERKWIDLSESKTAKWRRLLDSLAIPFENSKVPDTTIIYLGHSGKDDGIYIQA